MNRIVTVSIKTNSKQSKVEKINADFDLKVYVKAQPIEGKANKELLSLLKQYFKQRGYKIQKIFIIKGTHSKKKIVKIKYNSESILN